MKKRYVVLAALFILASVAMAVGLERHVHLVWRADLTTAVFSVTALVFDTWTLLATVFIAVYIYRLQKRDENEAERRKRAFARTLVALAVEDSLQWLLRLQSGTLGVGRRLGEYVQTYGEILLDDLPLEHFRRLSALAQAVEQADVEDGVRDPAPFCRPWLRPILASAWAPLTIQARNGYDLLERDTYNLCKALHIPGTEGEYQARSVIYDRDGQRLFAQASELHPAALDFAECVYNIFADQAFLESFAPETLRPWDGWQQPGPWDGGVQVFDRGQLVACGQLGVTWEADMAVTEGFVRGPRYAGFVHQGYFCGPGVAYNHYGGKTREGYWADGTLLGGMEYQYLLRDPQGVLTWNVEKGEYDGDGEALELVGVLQDGPLGLQIVSSEIEEFGLNALYVGDLKTMGEGYPCEICHIRPLSQVYQNKTRCAENGCA